MSAREFYEEARARVGEIIAAKEKDAAPTPPRKYGRYTVLPFAVASVVLSVVALVFATMRVTRTEYGTVVASMCVALALPLQALARSLLVTVQGGSDVCMFLAGIETLFALSGVATTVFPLSLFDGLAVQVAAMFAFCAIFGVLSVWMGARVRSEMQESGCSVLEDARSLKRGLDSALACYETDKGLGEYANLHGFRKRLAEVEAAYLAEIN
jgi:hypothetical protein